MFHSATETVAFTPADQKDRPEGERITYTLKVPTRLDQAKFRRSIVAEGARVWSPEDMRAAIRRGVDRMFEGVIDETEKAEVLEGLETYWSLTDDVSRFGGKTIGAVAAGKEENPELLEMIKALGEATIVFTDLEAEVRRRDRDYRERCADIDFYYSVALIAALRLFVLDWSGLEADCERDEDGLTLKAIGTIPAKHHDPLDQRIGALLRFGEAETKN